MDKEQAAAPVSEPKDEREFLAHYDVTKYERPSVTVDVVIFTVRENDLKVLLVQRRDHPFKDKWAIPGGFVNMKESLEDGARRELEEETGVQDVYMEQLYTFGDPDRDPRYDHATLTRRRRAPINIPRLPLGAV